MQHNGPTHSVTPESPVYLSAEQALALAWKRFDENDPTETEKLCLKIVTQNPENHQAWYLRGLAAQLRQDHEFALQCFEHAKNAADLLFPLSFARGRSYLALERTEEAIRHFKRALSLRADDAPSHYWLGVALQAQGEMQEARKELRRATLLDPKLGLAFADYGAICLALGDTTEAIDALQSAVRLMPQVAILNSNLALAYQQAGQPDAAESAYRAALAIDPDCAEAHFGLGQLLVALQRHDEAKPHLDRAKALKPELAEWENSA